jgi:hypothetical protein
VRQFASPVVYTIEVDDKVALPTVKKLTPEDLLHYADTDTIPLYESEEEEYIRFGIPFKLAELARMERLLAKCKIIPEICKLSGLKIAQVVEASYLNAEGSLVSCDPLRPTSNSSLSMQILSGFIAALGVAAVAAAFVALNAAALSIPGVVVAAIGLTASTLGTIGLFKYAPQTSAANNDHEVLLEMPSA